ncbi:MAG: adenylate/guanylate cyclase domain-containing protein [Arenicellales bacterium]|nr:adenylate/guanylate cyclase domain-containing protein [Arenicellales bacterium]
MNESKPRRKLAAILAADVVNFSALMGENEDRTLRNLKACRALTDDCITANHGRIFGSAGDSIIAEFASPVDAVVAATEFQRSLRQRNEGVAEEDQMMLRVGLNLGDVIVEGDNLYGDGVNVAARLEALAEPGGISLSGKFHEEVCRKLDMSFVSTGEQEMKNIRDPVSTYKIELSELSKLNLDTSSDDLSGAQNEPVTVEDNENKLPAIAVLPFTNMSGDQEQEYFADGIVEDLITALSRFPWLFVISRNTSFSYKGENVQAKRVAEDLGVRYIVEGSLRMSPSRLRVTVQLIDAVNDRHVWAENYDRPTGDLFDLQDEISQAITGVLVPALGIAERERFQRENHPKLDSWTAYQKGLAHYYRPFSHEDHAECRRLFDQSVELDRSFSDAHAMIAMMGAYSIRSGQTSYTGSREEILSEAEQAAERAVQLQDGNALAHLALAPILQLKGQLEAGILECETAIRLNPNLALAHNELGFILFNFGRLEDSVESFDRAIRLSPNDPSRWNFFLIMGFALTCLEQFDQAVESLLEASRLRSSAFWPFLGLAAAYSGQGEMEKAKAAIDKTLELKPDWTVAKIMKPGGDSPEHIQNWANWIQQAGLPAE